jgi:DnaJ-class molecular chaperone
MISEIRGKYPKASDDWHPGPKAMKEYAKQIYTEIQKGT